MAGPASGRPETWAPAYFDAWNTRDPAAIAAFMADDLVWVDNGGGDRLTGVAAFREYVAGLSATFSSDYRFEPGDVVGDEAGYAIEWTMVGTHDRAAPTRGLPATGRTFRFPAVSVGRVRDGLVVENHDYWNLAAFLQQVGLMPAAARAG
ncbi:ester cyclase [Blastococcus sp. SYSU D00669]